MRLDKVSIEKVYSWYKSRKNFLVYTGNTGCGKTYLCSAIWNYNKKNKEYASARYWNERELFARIRRESQFGYNNKQVMESLTDDDLLILDDVGSNYMIKGNEELFFDLVDVRYSNLKPMIITTNLDSSTFEVIYGPRTASRIFATENTFINVRNIDIRKEIDKFTAFTP